MAAFDWLLLEGLAMKRLLLGLLALSVCTGCSTSEKERESVEERAATVDGIITAARYRHHIEVLSSDAMEGRAPGSKGAKMARSYIIARLRECGIRPANGQRFEQRVPLRRVETEVHDVRVIGGATDRRLMFGPEFMGNSRKGPGRHVVDGELLFVGFGAQAPEYDWDDFKGVDCRGKILVMLVGDPPTEDRNLFGGPAMTYYGRWTYKYDKAEELGAAGCIVVHKTPWAGYGWAVVENSGRRPKMRVREDDPNRHMGLEGWVTWKVAEELVAGTGRSLDELASAAARRDFKPVPLGRRLHAELTTTSEPFEDKNVAGILPGSDPDVADEFLIFTAHYDHLGKGEGKPGDDVIYNGAVDNASGCAGLLTLAEAMSALPVKPRRSTMFLFVGSEEQGLLGSRYYTEHPLVPIKKTVANINIDGLNVWEPTRDLQVIGYGQSSLDDVLESVLAGRSRVTLPDLEPEKGLYYRSDHFNFARVGVPALYVKTGEVVPGRPQGWLKRIKDDWVKNRYHRPADELQPDWTCSGGAEDLRVFLRVALQVLNGYLPPFWSDTSEFKDLR
ncbi:MAG TPA: M20/M25/M40 family metallo-hydrolase [Planctomycetes bacterium]|nr:M20/M25/M40 family metallo-hydrolase [Planctomycetota bacterium]